jgi:amidophosphoribosyltransferase
MLAGAHNGNVANYAELLHELPAHGRYLDSHGLVDDGGHGLPPSDSEVLFRRIARAAGDSWPERIVNGLVGVEGAYSLILTTDADELIALRDPWGIRPLSWGVVDGHYLVASETCVLDSQRAVEQYEIQPGEMWRFRPGEPPERIVYRRAQARKYCDFEDWYFSFPPSVRDGVEVREIRKRCGIELAREERARGRLVDADLVIGIPDTGRTGAITFARTLDLEYDEGIYRGRSGKQSRRTFIEKSELLREQGGEHKYKPSRSLRGKVLYVVDDSSVRLVTWRILFKNLREHFGVRAIHARSLAPKFIRPCVLGVNINGRQELGAVEMKAGGWEVRRDEAIAREVGADSVAFLSMAGRANLRRHFGEDPDAFCGYCHGEEGPPFRFSVYDPERALERTPVRV